MADALCMEPLDDVYVLPEVRDILDHARAARKARDERQSR
jgi:hypothetical protein